MHDDFRVVKRRKKKKQHFREAQDLFEVTETSVKGKLKKATEELKQSKFSFDLLQNLDYCIKEIESTAVGEIICFGLGNFSDSKSALHQLAVLVTLYEKYKSRIHPLTKEIVIEDSYKYNNTFNDLSIHYFNHCELVTSFFTDSLEVEPIYSENTEFITKGISSLGIKYEKGNSELASYILTQCYKHQVTDEQVCKAREEMKFLAETYLCYLRSQRLFEEIHRKYQGKGERSIKETAEIVGFKLPHDPK
ncbi:hypothetical protein RUM43_007897 [Polyplax serrata]|uniref:Protein FMC1 homolog n=1 Tax=Polyplax serrata TaxID=468196 RepID=A0AAN8P2I6_POLSC